MKEIKSMKDIRRIMLSFDSELVAKKLKEFIRNIFHEANARKVFIGVSGGVDSATTLKLTIDSVGKDNVIALIMPHHGITSVNDVEDAYTLVDKFGVEYTTIEIADMCSLIKHRLVPYIEVNTKTYGNIMARVRMITLYAFANSMNGIVAGTSDKSERLIGYFTKWGDAAADFFPIMDLYKTQVRVLAKHIGVPQKITEKPSSPGLWKGHTAEGELGLSYETIDTILFAIYEFGMTTEELVKVEGISEKEIQQVLNMIKSTEHKRKIAYPQVQHLIVRK